MNKKTLINKFLHLLQTSKTPAHIHQIQAQLILHNLHPNTAIASRFISACQSFSLLPTALLLYTHIPKNTRINELLHLLQTCKTPFHIHQIQAQLILHNLHPNTTIASHFISACQSFSLLPTAFLLYTHLPKPHVFICNTLLSALSHSHSHYNSATLYKHMHTNSVSPNNYTFPLVLKSLADLRDVKVGQLIHTHVVKLGYLFDIYVQNSLLNLYGSSGNIVLCRKVFDEMPLRDVVSWTVMINGYRVVGKFDSALLSFEQMQFEGVVPNRVTMVNALAACASFGAIDMGVSIHEYVIRSKWDLDVVIGTSLIDMYGKCGRIERGLDVFKSMKEKNVFTWNAIIKGLALAKSGEEALQWFSRMGEEGIIPDQVTLLAVLCACVHSVQVERGREIFSLLVDKKYGFSPTVKHYACMVDLLARSGYLMNAMKVIDEMPYQPTKSVWGALLSGCRSHGDLELSEFAAWKLVEMEPNNTSYYVLLSNLYADMGRWSEAEEVRCLMKDRGLKKDSGSSFLELEPQELVNELLA